MALGVCLCFCLALAFGAEGLAKETLAKDSAVKDAPVKDLEVKAPPAKAAAAPKASAKAGLKFKAQLIWGTDLEKPDNSKDKKIKDLEDPKLKEKLSHFFKWKNYYQVDLQTIVVPLNGSQITCMSHDCMVEIFHHGDKNVELHLYGENILVQKIRQELCKGQYMFTGGNIKNKENEAWIVSICLAE